MFQSVLQSICVTGITTEEDLLVCPYGTRPLFTEHMIHQTHLLLFETAIMHIIVTCSTFYMTLARVRGWRRSGLMTFCSGRWQTVCVDSYVWIGFVCVDRYRYERPGSLYQY